MPQVILVRNPHVLFVPEVQEVLKRTLASNAMIAPGGLDSVAEDLFAFTTRPDHFFYLGAEDGKFKAVAMGYLPSGKMFPYPTIVAFYNEGSKALARQLKEQLLDRLLKDGYTKVWAVNGTGRPDEVWLRAFELDNKTRGSVKGSLIELEVI